MYCCLCFTAVDGGRLRRNKIKHNRPSSHSIRLALSSHKAQRHFLKSTKNSLGWFIQLETLLLAHSKVLATNNPPRRFTKCIIALQHALFFVCVVVRLNILGDQTLTVRNVQHIMNHALLCFPKVLFDVAQRQSILR